MKLEGTVEHVIYENADSGYAVFEVDAGGTDVVVAGNVGGVDNGMSVTVYGHMVNHPSYGEQFRAETIEARLPEDRTAILSYLSSGVLPYIGPSTAKKIVAKFGDETLTVIAYYQPATKALVEQIRGVDSAYCVSALVTKKLIRECKPIHFDGNGYSDEWKAEARKRGLDCETSTPLIFDRYLDKQTLRMFGDTGVFSKVELEARTEVKWETYTKKIQIEGRVLGDLAMNHIVPIASKYEALLLDKVYKMSQIPGLNASADIELIKKIQYHTAEIQRLTAGMVDARKGANRIEDQREKAIAYHDTVAACFDEIRRHIDKLEEIVDDQMWPLPKYRELLFLR